MKVLEDDIKEIIRLYKEGVKPKEIGIRFDMRSSSVIRIIRKQGIKRTNLIRVNKDGRDAIVRRYLAGESSELIAKDMVLNGSTVCRILKRAGIVINSTTRVVKCKFDVIGPTLPISKNAIPTYGTTYVVKYNDIPLTTPNQKLLTPEQKEEAAKIAFDFYRAGGFPYTILTDDEIIKDFTALKNTDVNSILKEDNVLTIYNMNGIKVFKHFAPHFFEQTSSVTKKLSMFDTFNDDKLFLAVIKNRLDQNYKICGNMIKQGLATSKIAFKGSIFNPAIAKFIYNKFTKEGDIIYDYSMGYGQRLLAALSLPHTVKYIGADPFGLSYDSNRNIFNHLNEKLRLNKSVDLNKIGSENFCDEKYKGKVNLAFSSPPYFNHEVYEKSDLQAGSKNYNDFVNVWWNKTVSNIDYMLTDDGYLILNMKDKIGNFNILEDMTAVICRHGFKMVDTYKMQLSRNTTFMGRKGIAKLEPIIVFQK